MDNTTNNDSEYRVHGTQNNQLDPSVSTQKSVLKNIHRVHHEILAKMYLGCSENSATNNKIRQ